MWSKIWTVIVALSFALWFAVMIDRLGALYVVGFIVLALAFRYFGVDK